MNQMSMLGKWMESESGHWSTPRLPDLGKYKWLWADCEATGLDIMKSKPVGYSFYAEDGNKWYIPFAHAGGGNIDEKVVKRWFQKEIRGKELVWLNAKYDMHMTHNWGVDLEALGNRCHDVAYQAALLDEHRRRFNLEQLCQDVLGQGKDKSILKGEKSEIAQMPAWAVGPYAEVDAQRVYELDMALRLGTNSKLKNSIKSDEQEKVLELEDSILYAVVAMERKGALIDRPKLEQWVKEAEDRYQRECMQLYRMVGFRVNPDSPEDMTKLFKHLGIVPPQTPAGADSFEGPYLERIEREEVKLALSIRRVASILSKYLKKYLHALDSHNTLRFSLHQLRGDEKGTISGRFSCAAPKNAPGANIQQIMRTKDQIRKIGPMWLIRELFIPEPGKTWICSDASQIEFRLFAHYANSRKLNEAYGNNPKVDFHDMVRDLIRQVIPDFDRQPAKTINFSKVYGAGRAKIADQLGIDQSISDKFVDAYEDEFPESGKLLRKATRTAEDRHWVKTLLGRRARFEKPNSSDPKIRMMQEIAYKPHSALNRVLQGTAADIMKIKIKEVYDARKDIGLEIRFVVHDEFDGDGEGPQSVEKLDEILNHQSVDLRIPILWESKSGANWKESK